MGNNPNKTGEGNRQRLLETNEIIIAHKIANKTIRYYQLNLPDNIRGEDINNCIYLFHSHIGCTKINSLKKRSFISGESAEFIFLNNLRNQQFYGGKPSILSLISRFNHFDC
jgi:hypothetical protein